MENVHDVSWGHLSAETLGNGLSNLLDLGASDEKGNVEAVVTEGLEKSD